jgi:hypothetical protein
VLAPVMAARPSEEAPLAYGAWMGLRPITEAWEEEEEDEEAVACLPTSPAPTSVSFPRIS